MLKILKQIAELFLSSLDFFLDLVAILLAEKLVRTAEYAGDEDVKFELKTKVLKISSTKKKGS